MEIEFCRELDGSYLSVTEEERGDVFTEKMLTEARPPQLLSLKAAQRGEGYEYRYEIGGCRSLEAMLSKREMSGEEIRDLMRNIYRVTGDMEEYLLDPAHLWLEPGLIFYGRNGWMFCLHPAREEELYGQLQALSRYLLKKADHDDEDTTRMAYELFRVCHEDNYSFAEIREVLEPAGKAAEQAAAENVFPEKEELPEGRRIRKSLFGRRRGRD